MNSLTLPKQQQNSDLKKQSFMTRANNSFQNLIFSKPQPQTTKNFEDNFEKSTPDEKRNYFTHKTKTR